MCTKSYTPLPFAYFFCLCILIRLKNQFNTLSFVIWCFKVHMHTHQQVRGISNSQRISALKYIFITITQLPDFSVFSPFHIHIHCVATRLIVVVTLIASTVNTNTWVYVFLLCASVFILCINLRYICLYHTCWNCFCVFIMKLIFLLFFRFA